MRSLSFALRALLVLGLAASRVAAQVDPLREDTGHTGLGLALRPLGTTASVLYITAHPDDENNALLSVLSRGRGMRVGLLTLTRGEGGQNEIGAELSDALGVLRTEELLAVHRHDGAEQFFTLAYEFGYSFSVEETFEKWGKRQTLGDIVWVVRSFRPDVVLTMVPTGAGGGQHHQASARLALEAFEQAADPRSFPEHLAAGLRPWQARKLYHVLFATREKAPPGVLRLPVGDFDAFLGMSYAEYGALARNSHRCQGMNAPAVPGPRWVELVPAAAAPGTSLEGGLVSGIDPTVSGLAAYLGESAPASFRRGLRELEVTAEESRDALRSSAYGRVAERVLAGLGTVRDLRRQRAALPRQAAGKLEVDHRLAREEAEWNRAAARAHQLLLRATVVPSPAGGVVDGLVTRGESFQVEVLLVNRGRTRIEVESLAVEVPPGWQSERLRGTDGELRYNGVVRWRFRVTVGEEARLTAPHWSRRDPSAYRVQTTAGPGESLLPFRPPPVHAVLSYRSEEAAGTPAFLRTPVQHRWYDPAAARHRGFAVKVVPRVSVRISPALGVVPLERAREGTRVDVMLRNHLPRPAVGELRLEPPSGWRSDPPGRSVEFTRENEEVSLRFRLVPSPASGAGEYRVAAVARFAGREYREGFREIDYHHIQRRHLYRRAEATLALVDVKLPAGLRVAYVMGVGDEVPAAIESLGAELHLLGAQDLESGDLSRFDAIVTGIRAYKDRSDLVANNRRLLEYVARGGVMIVQYNKYEFNRAQYGPYPLSISRPHDRVTDENAPVKVLVPDSPLFHAPNELTAADWRGWVQERGLYFLGSWDERYIPLLEIEDPFPYNPGKKRGALVMARHGKGVYVYTGLGFFRQLPAGVPGAYRLFANLLSLSRTLVAEGR
ncbi:MAG: PIG-L family deacetylase [Planctomycetota bacterium]|nr:PIG-L family deacetylase [Planctomycetota bacterium]